MDCLFCKIVAGEIPSDKIYEDDLCLAFKDIHPVAPFHVLVVPKKHIAKAADITGEDAALIGHLFAVIADLAKDQNGFRVVTNSGKEAGQSVDHLHFHVMSGRKLSLQMG